MVKTVLSRKQARLWRVAATSLFVLLAVLLLVSHAANFQQSLNALRHAELGWVGLGLGLTSLTFLLAAGIYSALALHHLRLRQTLLVELAAAFANRLLPAGLGGLGLHGVYLYKKRHTAAQATAVVSVNNLLGIAMHLTLLCVLIILQPGVLRHLHLTGLTIRWWYVVAAIILLGVLCVTPKVRHQLARFGRNLVASLHLLHPPRVVFAMFLAAMLTATFTGILFCAAHSVDIHLNILQIFVVFSLGMLAGTATPTPGGLVGAEAGLFAGFVAYGVNIPMAGAAVLLYRLLTYWLPLVPGAIAMFLARQRQLV